MQQRGGLSDGHNSVTVRQTPVIPN